MNKTFTTLFLGIAVLYAACKKKDETPAPVDTTFYAQFSGKIDGVPVSFAAPHQNFFPFAGRMPTINADTDKMVYYGGIPFDNGYEHGIVALRGPLLTPAGITPSENYFLSLFDKGPHAYVKQKFEIIYMDSAGVHWSTRLGDQTNSRLEITDATSTGTPTAPRCRVTMKFTCRVHKPGTPWLYKEITDGVLITEFTSK